MKRRVWLSALAVAGVLGIGVGGLFLLTSFKAEAAKNEEVVPARAVRTCLLSAGPQDLTIETEGFLKSARQVEIQSPVAGRIVSAPGGLEGGTVVEKGDVLIALDDRRSRLAFESARSEMIRTASLFISRAELSEAESGEWNVYLENLGSADPDMLNEPPFGDSRTQLLASTMGVLGAWHSLKSAAMDLADHKVVAPFSGILSGDGVVEGGWVTPGIPLALLVDCRNLEVGVALSVDQLSLVQTGTEAFVILDGHEPLIALVDRIEPILSEGSQSVRADIVFKVPGESCWLPGSYVSVRIAGRHFDSVYRVPRESLVGDSIPVLDDGKLDLIPVSVLARDGADVILAGTLPGETQMITTLLQNPVKGLPLRQEGDS